MNILVYFQSQHRTVFIESLAEGFIKKGHKVYFLTTCEKGILHEQMEKMGAIAFSYNPKGNKYLLHIKQLVFFINYCRKNKIDVVYSHLQLANLTALFAQYFVHAKVFPCRHHADDVALGGNKNALRIDRLVNRLSNILIVPSNAVKLEIVEKENKVAEKIKVIPYGYNFDRYDTPDPKEVNEIKERLKCELLLIIIGRMTVNKRHVIALKAFNRLVKDGLDVKLIIMDGGPEKEAIEKYIHQNNLNNRIYFTGFVNNTMNYLSASDLLLHPSISEASNQVVKEAGILSKPTIVCKNVGDFDEYIINRENSFSVSIQHAEEEMYTIIKEFYFKKVELQVIGERLKRVIFEKFSADQLSTSYLDLMND